MSEQLKIRACIPEGGLQPYEGQAAWLETDLEDDESWIRVFTLEEIEEIESAGGTCRAEGYPLRRLGVGSSRYPAWRAASRIYGSSWKVGADSFCNQGIAFAPVYSGRGAADLLGDRDARRASGVAERGWGSDRGYQGCRGGAGRSSQTGLHEAGTGQLPYGYVRYRWADVLAEGETRWGDFRG